MSILGHGIDIVSVARIGEMLERHGQHFLNRCFTHAEQGYALAAKRRDEHLAGRFAAKEAALKALGTGWRHGIAWTDVEVVRLPSGQPTLRVSGQAGEIARQSGIGSWLVSISHTDQHAVASVIAMK
jgi:holo-[acyl-carrier protein] synthase